jgi:hypothetical protein
MNGKILNVKKWKIFMILAVILALNVACGFSASTANIKEAKMARDNEGAQPTTTFAPTDTTFFCNIDLANAPDDTKIKAVWTAVQVEGADPETLIDQSELTAGSGTLHFKLATNSSWPAGKYKVDLYLNDKLDRTVEFQVQ